MMKRILGELKKLISVKIFISTTILKAVFQKDCDAKKTLSELYLKNLNSKSIIPIENININSISNYKVASFVYQDMLSTLDSRLMKLTILELFSLLTLLKKVDPKNIFEFGLLNGGSLYHLYLNTNEDVHITSLDCNLENFYPKIENELKNQSRINIIHEDSTQFDPKSFKSSMDFIFIDGGHDYEIVKNDSEKALQMLAPNGVIVWDDYNTDFSGVYKYLNELQGAGLALSHIKNTSLVYLKGSSKLL